MPSMPEGGGKAGGVVVTTFFGCCEVMPPKVEAMLTFLKAHSCKKTEETNKCCSLTC